MSHSTKFCKNTAKCLSCGLEKHNEADSCSNILCCINYKGCHRSLSKECPEIIIKKRTTELMAQQNIDYNTARKIVLQGSLISSHLTANKGGESNQPTSSSFNPMNFPLLQKSLSINQGKPIITPVCKLTLTQSHNNFAATIASHSDHPSALSSLTSLLNLSPEDICKFINIFKLLSDPKISAAIKKILEEDKLSDPPI